MKKYNFIPLFLLLTLVILLNIVGAYINLNIDFTKDNLHSISKQSKIILENLKDKIFVKIYLNGDFPAEFKHLQSSTYNLLKRF